MTNTLRSTGAVLFGALLAAACGAAEPETAGAEPDAAPPAAASAATGPDTTAEAVWAYLEEQAYRSSWPLWPGRGNLYPGSEPHGMLLTTYANTTAYEALLAGEVADLPAGSIIVKENWMPDSTFAAATVMYRVEGYNPEHQDWLFAKFDPQGIPESFGRAPMCQACHQNAENGYIYTAVER